MTRPDPPLRHIPRPIRSHGIRRYGDWSVKLYGIGGSTPAVSAPLLQVAEAIARDALPEPAVTATRYGVGFVVVHEAPAFNTIVVDWWEQVNELRHRVFRALPASPLVFRDITASGESVCVWELRIQAVERQAWLDHVLLPRSGPELKSYLAVQHEETC